MPLHVEIRSEVLVEDDGRFIRFEPICKHCKMFGKDHDEGRCLYDSALYEYGGDATLQLNQTIDFINPWAARCLYEFPEWHASFKYRLSGLRCLERDHVPRIFERAVSWMVANLPHTEASYEAFKARHTVKSK